MSPATASTLAVPKPIAEPRCQKCNRGPLLPGEVNSGRCPYCTSTPASRADLHKCRACGVVLGLDDDRVHRVCLDCATRPDVKRRLATETSTPAAAPPISPRSSGPAQAMKPPQSRAFTPAEKSLIKHVHAFMPMADLLRVLNERLVADLGAAAVPYTLEQLQAEIAPLHQATRPADDWASLRRILADIRGNGILGTLTPDVLDTFCVVFQLSAAQRTHLHDVIRSAKEGV